MALQLPGIPSFDVFTAGNTGQALMGGVNAFQNAYAQAISNELNRKRQEQVQAITELEKFKLQQQKELSPYERSLAETKLGLEKLKLQQQQELAPYSLEATKLGLKKEKAEEPYYEQMAKANLDYKLAQINRQNQLASPYNIANIKNGPAKWALDLETVRIANGENSTIYKNAKKDYDTRISQREKVGAGVGGQQLVQLHETVKRNYPHFDDKKVWDTVDALIEGKRVLPDGTKINEPTGSQRTLLDEIETKRRGMKAVNQAMRANTLDAIMGKADSHIQGAVTYAGLPGAGKYIGDQVATAFGQDVKSYNDYFLFTRSDVPNMMGEMLLTLGGNSTDSQKEMMRHIADPVVWDSNPKLALMTWMYLRDLYKNVISPSILQSPSEVKEAILKRQDPEKEQQLLGQLKILQSNVNKPHDDDDYIANLQLSTEKK